MGQMYFNSDIHHRHKNIVRFTRRSHETNEENHDEWIVRLWNRQVRPEDTVYSLGDLSFTSKYDDLAKFVSRLNGSINLIKGNHDKSEYLDQLVKDGLIISWEHYKEVKIAGVKTCLFHFPISSWNGQMHGSWHLHGHSHSNHRDSRGKMLDVGLDSSYNIFGEHKFFTEDNILEYMQTKQVYSADSHRNKE